MKHKILWQKLHNDTLQWHYYRLTESSNEPALTSIKKQMFTPMSISCYFTLNKNPPPKILRIANILYPAVLQLPSCQTATM